MKKQPSKVANSLEIGLKNSLLYLFCGLGPFKSGRYALRQTKSYCNSKQWYKEHSSTKCRNVEERISMQSSFFSCKRYLFDGTALLDKKKKMGTQNGVVQKIRWAMETGEGSGKRNKRKKRSCLFSARRVVGSR